MHNKASNIFKLFFLKYILYVTCLDFTPAKSKTLFLFLLKYKKKC